MQCYICLHGIQPNSSIIQCTQCNKCTHIRCMAKWIKERANKYKCPHCNYEFNTLPIISNIINKVEIHINSPANLIDESVFIIPTNKSIQGIIDSIKEPVLSIQEAYNIEEDDDIEPDYIDERDYNPISRNMRNTRNTRNTRNNEIEVVNNRTRYKSFVCSGICVIILFIFVFFFATMLIEYKPKMGNYTI